MDRDAKYVSLDRLWTVHDVAEFLQLSTSWVYKAAALGILPVRRIGACLRFRPDEVRAFASGDWRPTPAELLLGKRKLK